jgi:hypothetical protein
LGAFAREPVQLPEEQNVKLPLARSQQHPLELHSILLQPTGGIQVGSIA